MITLTWPMLGCLMILAASLGLKVGLIVALRDNRVINHILGEHTKALADLVERVEASRRSPDAR